MLKSDAKLTIFLQLLEILENTPQRALVEKNSLSLNLQAVKVEAFIFYFIKEPFFVSFEFDTL